MDNSSRRSNPTTVVEMLCAVNVKGIFSSFSLKELHEMLRRKKTSSGGNNKAALRYVNAAREEFRGTEHSSPLKKAGLIRTNLEKVSLLGALLPCSMRPAGHTVVGSAPI